jgi:hypothetical protein
VKLLRVRIRNLLGIREADLDLSRPMNLILGPNGSGKSSVADAIRWALTRRCRGTDAAGRGAAQLIHRGASEGGVELTAQGRDGRVHIITRMQDGATGTVWFNSPDEYRVEGRAAENEIELLAGTPSETIEIALDPMRFLSMDGRTQSSLLAGAIGLRLTAEEFMAACKDYGISANSRVALSSHLTARVPGFQGGTKIMGPDEMSTAYQVFYDDRRDRKKELALVEEELRSLPSGPVPSPEALGASRMAAEEIAREQGACSERVGMWRCRQSEHARLVARKHELERQVAALESPTEEPQSDLELAPSIPALEAEVAALEDAYRAAEAVENAAMEERVQAVRDAEAGSLAVAQARDGDASCPAKITDHPCPILLPLVDQRKGQVPRLITEAKKLEGIAAKARKAEHSSTAATQRAVSDLGAKQEALQSARMAAARAQGQEATQSDLIRAELGRIEKELAGTEDPAQGLAREEQLLLSLSKKRQAQEAVLRELEASAQAAGERKRIDTRLQEFQGEVGIADELTRALDPKALPARILQSRIGPVQDGLNQVLSDITGGQYRVSLEAGEKGVEMNVWKEGVEHPLFLQLLSHSERLRLGTAVSAAFALMTPLRILAIDEVDSLLDSLKGILVNGLDLLLAPDGDLETVLMFESADKPEALGDEMGVFWVRDGKVTHIDEDWDVAS